ncbi:response regulator [Emticicia sp. CRIBPO]|uniref:response regulator n=1 Tax=Emticicia sp. CRIBPO TaxID=2683258 RepID=UPI0014135B91|nr:response regulator transcription factor [Emticicia sp. CRIBPO]NBA85941.1 response regulator [Emticicia sp. CRIBPO]
MINVLIADDHNVFAEGISSLLSDTENISVVASCFNTADVRDMLIKTRPQVILLDISMPKVEDGMKLCDHILQHHPEIKIIILTMHDDLSIVKRVLKKGAHGFLLKNTTKAELLDAIAHVSQGQAYINDYIQKQMEDHQHKTRKHAAGTGVELNLTPREKEVLFLISEGYTTQQIADKLFVTTKAVEFHRSSLLVKFDVPNTALLIKTAMEANFL